MRNVVNMKRKGFTLLELMMAMAVFSTMMALVTVILIRGQRQALLNDAKMNLQTTIRQSLYQMSMEIHETSPGRVTIGTGGSSLSFQLPSSVGNSGNIAWSGPVTYQIGGNGRQLIRNDGSRATVLANDVSAVSFSMADPSTLVYSVTTQRTMPDGRLISVASTGSARLRNA